MWLLKADAMRDVNDHFYSVFAHLALRTPVTVAKSDATIDVNDDFHSAFVHLALRILVTCLLYTSPSPRD